MGYRSSVTGSYLFKIELVSSDRLYEGNRFGLKIAEDYKNHITGAFTKNTRSNFVDWRYCGRLCTDVTDALEDAKEGLCAEERYEELFKLCNWAYVKWSKTNKDDSNGETQFFCKCISDIWEAVYIDGEQSVSHKKMLDTLLKHLDGRLIDYMEDDIYDFVLNHFKTKEELAKKEQFLLTLMDKLKKQIPEKEIVQYTLNVIEEYYARVLADQGRPIEEIRDFLNKRNRYSTRELLAQIEKDYGNYNEAIALYKEQINERSNYYWADGPRKALMDIYKLHGDTQAYNAELYNMMLGHTGEDKYFLEYKALFTKEEWKVKWEELLAEFKDRLSMINLWLSLEGRYDIIMDNAEPDDEYVIDGYGEKLFELYPERCFKVLANAADNSVVISKNRRDYRYVARILRKIAAHRGGKELASQLAAKYRAQYPRRTAMLDELRDF